MLSTRQLLRELDSDFGTTKKDARESAFYCETVTGSGSKNIMNPYHVGSSRSDVVNEYVSLSRINDSRLDKLVGKRNGQTLEKGDTHQLSA